MSDVAIGAPTTPPRVTRPSLALRVRQAGSWTIVGQVLGQAIRLLSNLVLARLLAPDSFGLMSVVYMLTAALAFFSDLGIGRSVVQSRRGADADFLDTAWTLGVLRGTALATLTLLIGLAFLFVDHFHWAPAATVYADSRLPWVICAFAVNVAISSLESIRIHQAHREVQLQRLTKIDVGTQLASAIVMVAFALLTRSVWALVFGALFSNALRVGLSYLVLSGHRVRFRLEHSALKELMGNARWIFISSILGFLSANGDRVLLSGLINADSFGLYAVAVLLSSAVQTLGFAMSISLAYPAFSEVFRERPQDLHRTIANFLLIFDALITLIAAALIVAGPALVHLLYDQRYQQAGWILRVLAISIIGLRCQLVEQVYQAMGKPALVTLANLLRLAALVVGIYVGNRFWGFKGIVYGVALSPFVAWPMAFAFMLRESLLTWRGNALLVPALLGGGLLGLLIESGISWLIPAGHSAIKSLVH